MIVLIRNENPAKIARLRKLTFGLLSPRRKRMRAGRVIARGARTTRLPYQIFVSLCCGRKLAKTKFTLEKTVSLSGLSHDDSAATVTQKQALAANPSAIAPAKRATVGHKSFHSILK